MEFDFETQKSIIWAYGFMTLSIIALILVILQLFTLMVYIVISYLAIFLLFMFRMELKIRIDKLNLYELLAGIKVLESNTVIDEYIVEESIFYIKNLTTLEKDKDLLDIPQTYKDIDISSWKVLKCTLFQPDTITKYEVQQFIEFYILSPGEDITAFHEEPNVNIIFQGKAFIGTKLKGDLVFITWILPDKPLFLLYNSPKLALPFASIRKDLEALNDATKQTLTQEILDLKEKQKNFDYIISEKHREIELLAKQKDLATLRAEFIQTETLEKPDPEIDPYLIYVNRGLLWFLAIGFLVSTTLFLATILGRLGL